MAKLRQQSVVADFIAAAVAPALVMGMIYCLISFLILVFYRDGYQIRVNYLFALYIFASVLIARIAIESGRAYALGYTVALGLAMMVVIGGFAVFQGPLAIFSPLINLGLIALVGYLADRIVFDCTLVEADRDTSGEGLLQSLGLVHSDLSKDSNTKRIRKRKHNPGVTVLYFALLAIPLYGIGQLFLPMGNDAIRRAALYLLFGYFFCSFALLVTTSFLGLRRYLNDRGVEVPVQFSATWLSLGLVGTLVFLAICLLLPLPGRQFGLFDLPFDIRAMEGLTASRWGWGNEGAEDSKSGESQNVPTNSQGISPQGGEGQQAGDQAAGGQSSGGQSSGGQSSGGQSSGGQSSGGQSSGGQSSGGQSSGGQSSGGQSSGGQSSGGQTAGTQGVRGQKDSGQKDSGQKDSGQKDSGQKDSGQKDGSELGRSQQQGGQKSEGATEGAGEKGVGDQEGSQQTGKESKGTNPARTQSTTRTPPTEPQQPTEPQSERQDRSNSQGPENNNNAEQREAAQGAESPEPTPPSSSSSWGNFDFLSWLGPLLKWLTIAILIAVVLLYALYHRDELRKMWGEFLKWWHGLWGLPVDESLPSLQSNAMAARRRTFAAFSNPFRGGKMELSEMVRYTFEALEAWGAERGLERKGETTAEEYVRKLVPLLPRCKDDLAGFSQAYVRLAYAKNRPVTLDPAVLQRLWLSMEQSHAAPTPNSHG